MSALALLRELSARGIRLVQKGDRISLRGPGETLTPELTNFLRQHKPALAEAARRCPTCVECGAVIGPDEPECWWGVARVHLECGRCAWAREWRSETMSADTPWAMVH